MHIFFLLISRIKRIALFIVSAICMLVVYLFHLQIGQTSLFSHLSQKNFLRQETIASPRGNITDQHGALLATNRPVYTLSWYGTGNQSLTTKQVQCVQQLVLLNIISLLDTETILSAEKRSQTVSLKQDIPFELVSTISEQVPFNKNLLIKKTFERYYPYNDLACHIVGYLGIKHEICGKMGIERIYNKKLQGQTGKILKIINAIGHRIQAYTLSPASAGKTVKTTLDLSLQQIAEKLFPAHYNGCLLLMDDNGSIEVALSRPSFEPTIFLKPLTHKQWHMLQEKKGFINRAFSACYPPASLFKIVTVAAALESKLISADTLWVCTGYTNFKGRRYHCNKQSGHGMLHLKKAFAHSCNIPFYEIGKIISIDTLAHYAHDVGLGNKTGILFPEKSGLVPTTQWKHRIKREPWWPGETLSAVIGQSSLLVTPLQITCMLSAVCTGYRVRPRLLIDEPIVHEQLDIQPSTLAFLQHCLHSVIKKGTGTALKKLNGFTLHGKSGTAQVCSRANYSLTKKHRPHGYFAAHFYYKDEKPRTLVIFLEHAGSSRYAIDVALDFLTQYASLVNKKYAHKS